MDRAGYVLTKGQNNSYVLVDRAGDIHGLMRRIEGAKVRDLRQKFPDLKDMVLPTLSSVLKQRRPTSPTKKAGRLLRNAAYMFKPFKSSFAQFPTPSITPIMTRLAAKIAKQSAYAELIRLMRTAAAFIFPRKQKQKPDENELAKGGPTRAEVENAELLQWAWENGRLDMLAQFGITLPPDYFDF